MKDEIAYALPFSLTSFSVGKAPSSFSLLGKAIVGGRCVKGGNSDAAALREFWMRTALLR